MALVPFLAEAFEFPIFAVIAIGGSAFVGLVQGYKLKSALPTSTNQCVAAISGT